MPGKLSKAAIFNDRWRYHLIGFSLIALSSCAPKSTPNENGPVMSERKIKKPFEPILKFMKYRPGPMLKQFPEKFKETRNLICLLPGSPGKGVIDGFH